MQILSIDQQASIAGGADPGDIIDGACAVAGVVGIAGGPVGGGALAFCAGWGLGRWLFS